jgi:hypothetical protein
MNSELQHIVCKNARLAQIRVQIMQAVVHGPGRGSLDEHRHGVERRLICRERHAIRLLVGVVDRERRVPWNARARANERQYRQGD